MTTLGNSVDLLECYRVKEDVVMTKLKYLSMVASAGLTLAAIGSDARAQVAVVIGPAPVCPYGYYDYAPYACSPYGYYGPEWFVGGVFFGVGPWFHGPANFHGHVNNQFDAQRGYRGRLPSRGERAEPGRRPDRVANFKGNEVRDGRGHVGDDRH